MDKPKGFIHVDRRGGYEVLVVGRVALPLIIFGALWIAGAATTAILALVGVCINQDMWIPAAWFFGSSLATALLLVIIGFIYVGVEIILEVNKKEHI